MSRHIALAHVVLALGDGKVHETRKGIACLGVNPVGVATAGIEWLVARLVGFGKLALLGCYIEGAQLFLQLLARFG